eukprot:CAMPEP_0202732454 /NCGR_PEP_ID=MMETSP1385-20130828/187667_1 /ASSEMBLY_ACC=CAM_ASM_000861 /TAXON_ID=933848 /ORGANISM="Elphidium margaritaceum" /LENGTH=1585 /DNA_ID=CAMNT_0049398769 /DNA_START=18 /DNA_END=4775 /DNA_ORIENTATION=-
MKIKIVQNKEIRVWKCPQRHKHRSLIAFVGQTFGLHDANCFSLQYQDDEGDTIIIKNDNDIEDAIAFAVEDGRKSLKIYVISIASMDDFLDDALADLFAPEPSTAQQQHIATSSKQSMMNTSKMHRANSGPQMLNNAVAVPSRSVSYHHMHHPRLPMHAPAKSQSPLRLQNSQHIGAATNKDKNKSVPSPLQLLKETASQPQRKSMTMNPEDILASMMMDEEPSEISVQRQPVVRDQRQHQIHAPVAAKRIQSADDILNRMMADMEQMEHKQNAIASLQSRIQSMPKSPSLQQQQQQQQQAQPPSSKPVMMKIPANSYQPVASVSPAVSLSQHSSAVNNGNVVRVDKKQSSSSSSSVTSSDDLLRRLLGDEHDRDEVAASQQQLMMDPHDVINSIVNRPSEVVVPAVVEQEDDTSVSQSHRDEAHELSMSDLKLDLSSDRKPPALSPLPASPPMQPPYQQPQQLPATEEEEATEEQKHENVEDAAQVFPAYTHTHTHVQPFLADVPVAEHVSHLNGDHDAHIPSQQQQQPQQCEPTIATNVPPVPFMQPHNSRSPSARKQQHRYHGQFETDGTASQPAHAHATGLSTDDVRHAHDMHAMDNGMNDEHEPSAPQHDDDENDEQDALALLAQFDALPDVPKHMVNIHEHVDGVAGDKKQDDDDDGDVAADDDHGEDDDKQAADEEEPDAETMEQIKHCLDHPVSMHDLNLAQIHADAQRDQLPEVAPNADHAKEHVYNAETPDDGNDDGNGEQKIPRSDADGHDPNHMLEKLYAELDDIDIDFELNQLKNANQAPQPQQAVVEFEPGGEQQHVQNVAPDVDADADADDDAVSDVHNVSDEPNQPMIDMSQEIHIGIDPANFESTPAPPEPEQNDAAVGEVGHKQDQEQAEEEDDNDEEMDLTQTTPDPIIPILPPVPVKPPPPPPPVVSEASNVVPNAPEPVKPAFVAAGDADADDIDDADATGHSGDDMDIDINKENDPQQNTEETNVTTEPSATTNASRDKKDVDDDDDDAQANDDNPNADAAGADNKNTNTAEDSSEAALQSSSSPTSPQSAAAANGSNASDINGTSPRDQRRETNRLLREEQRLQDKERKLQERQERMQQKKELQEIRKQQKEEDRIKRLQLKETHKTTQKYDKLRRARVKELTQFRQLSQSEIFDANKNWFPIKFVLDTANLNEDLEFETHDDVAQIIEFHASKHYRSHPSFVECVFNENNVFAAAADEDEDADGEERLLLPSDRHCVVYIYYNWSAVSNIKFQCIDLELCTDRRIQKLNVFRIPPWMNTKPTMAHAQELQKSPQSPETVDEDRISSESNQPMIHPNETYAKLLQSAIEKEKQNHVSRLKSMTSPLSLFKRRNKNNEIQQPSQTQNSLKSSTAQLLPENTEETPNFRWKFDLTQDYHLFDPLLNDDTLRRCMHEYEIYFTQIRSQAVVHDLPRLYDIYVVYLTCIADNDEQAYNELICNLDQNHNDKKRGNENNQRPVFLFLLTLLENEDGVVRQIMSYLRHDRCYGFVTVAKNTLPDSSAPKTEQVTFHFGGIGDWFKCAIVGEHDFEHDLKALQRSAKWNNQQHLSLQAFLQSIVTTYSM